MTRRRPATAYVYWWTGCGPEAWSGRRREWTFGSKTLFEAIEGRFGAQARFSVALAGLSGIWMLTRMGAWDRLTNPSHWWLDAMVLLWLVFAALIFLLEPLVLHRRFAERARRYPERTFRRLHQAHVVLFALALLTVLGAVAGSHGLMLFG